MTESEVFSILQRARIKNSRLQITGILLNDGTSFFQILEGNEEVVEELFSTIAEDTRHVNVVVIVKEAISERVFKDWTMGYAQLNTVVKNNIPGLNDFFKQQQCLTELDNGRAKKLLKAFASGTWKLS